MTRPARVRVAAVMIAVAAATLPSTASAGWTSPVVVRDAGGRSQLAVNARGDVAVAWIGSRSGMSRTDLVRVAVRRAGAARFSTHTLAARRGPAGHIAAALDRRGELTVAWSEAAGSRTRIRSAFRTATGSWSTAQTIGTSAYANVELRVAAAPDGTAALTYNARTVGPRRIDTAWRSRGRRFGTTRALAIPRALRNTTLAFDPAGTAYLAGMRICEGVVVTATARGRRFGAARTIAPGPILELRFAVTGRGSAIAAWLTGGCFSTEPFGGAPMTAALRSGRISRPASLGDPHGIDLRLSAAPGGAEAAWLTFTPPGQALRAATIARDGSVGPAHAPDGGWIAVVGDRRGDQLVRQVDPAQRHRIVEEPVAARPADGGPLDPAPLTVQSLGWDWINHAAAADGAALALMSFPPTGGDPRVTVWRPAGA